MIFNDLSKKERLELYQDVHEKNGLSKVIIEKDWWVTAVLRALFSLQYAGHLSFKGFDYNTLAPRMIRIVPPENVISLWQQDYETMQRTMIYGESLPFNKLIEKVKQLNEKINYNTGYL